VSARALLLTVLGSAPMIAAADEPPPAQAAPLAARTLLLALASAGERLVAVGDHGIIVYSDDGGRRWTQAAAVPTQALLTGVCFFDAQHGIAVGHDLVALTSADAGRTWQRTHYEPQANRPLLDVWCGSAGRAIAVGAYSTFLASADEGASWQERTFRPALRARPESPGSHQPDSSDNGYHLNRIVGSPAHLYLAAEAGHLYRSDDGGAAWRELPSPYEGSFFGVLPLEGMALLAYGLRGNLFRSDDGGDSWQRLASGTVAMLDGGARFGAQGVALVGLAGVLLVSRDGGHAFTLVQQADHSGLAAVQALDAATLVAVGESGARRIELGARAAAR
jgi:photosystem II stability/assembly factor-like uncharacterized protein